jgi:GT2 family glycosyltransferase
VIIRDNTFDNIGLSKAVNQSIRKSKGDILLFANPDVVFDESVGDMVKVTRQTGLGTLPRFIGYSPERRFPTTTRIVFNHSRLGEILNRFKMNPIDRDYTTPKGKIEQAGGSFLILQRNTVDKLLENGMFYDEQFPVLWNDVDLAVRAREKGVSFAIVDSCEVIHAGGHSGRAVRFERAAMLMYSKAGMIGFAEKWKMHPNILKLVFFGDAILSGILVIPAFVLGNRSRGDLSSALSILSRGIVIFRCCFR